MKTDMREDTCAFVCVRVFVCVCVCVRVCVCAYPFERNQDTQTGKSSWETVSRSEKRRNNNAKCGMSNG